MTDVEVLVSAMYQKDMSILDDTGVITDAVLINQCDSDGEFQKVNSYGTFRAFFTKERGLSKSRNMAVEKSKGKYCLLCDDDEILYENYKDAIINAYKKYKTADIICFIVKREGKHYPKYPHKIGYLRSLRIASWQITFKRDSIKKAGIKFDTEVGSGTKLGSGEENIFLFDCLKKGLKIYYVPITIGEVAQQNSKWFKGYTKEYFVNRGTIIKRLMGKKFGIFYCVYFAVHIYSKYKRNLSLFDCLKYLFEGMN